MLVGKNEKINLYDILIAIALSIFLMMAYFKGYSMVRGLEVRKLAIILGGMALTPFILLTPRLSLILFVIFASFAQANIHLGEYFDLSFVDIFTMAISLSFLLHTIFGTSGLKFPPRQILLPTILLLVFALFNSIYHFSTSTETELIAFNLKNIIIYLLLFLIFSASMHYTEDFRYLIYAVLAGVIISSVWALASIEELDLWSAIQGESGARVSNYAFFHSNVLGQFLVMTLPFAFFSLIYSQSPLMTFMAFWGSFIGGAALFLTFSRACWLATVAGIFFIFMQHRQAVVRFILAVAGFFVFLEILTVTVFDVSLWDLFTARFSELGESEFSQRPFIWGVAINLILENPIWGIGGGQFSEAFWGSMDVTYRRLHAHSTFLTLAAEWGIPFCLIFIFWHLQILLFGFKTLNTKPLSPTGKLLTQSLMAGLCGITFVMFFEHLFYAPLVATVFIIFCGLIIAVGSSYDVREAKVIHKN
ncbi:MAG: O-antigen ligase family protein [Candidatus Sumerlaeia bacterium]|nr:O-antigen ligase family protein [Candidatus Sumerlaeia bacterium]